MTAAPGRKNAFGTDNLDAAEGAVFLGDTSIVAAPSVAYDSDYTSVFTIGFSKPVADVRFDIFDIDAVANSFQEHVRVPGATVSAVGARVALIANQYQSTTASNVGTADPAGSVSFRFPTARTSIVVEVTTPTMQAATGAGANQHAVLLRNLRVIRGC
ncbi:hypothetical protein GCM10027427_12460 [Pseudoclavibacter terrae]